MTQKTKNSMGRHSLLHNFAGSWLIFGFLKNAVRPRLMFYLWPLLKQYKQSHALLSCFETFLWRQLLVTIAHQHLSMLQLWNYYCLWFSWENRSPSDTRSNIHADGIRKPVWNERLKKNIVVRFIQVENLCKRLREMLSM